MTSHLLNTTMATNISSNASAAGCRGEALTLASKIGETIGYVLILVFGVIGNTLVVAIVYRNRSMRTPSNYFIANMALADLLVPIFLVPHALVQVFNGNGFWLVPGRFGVFLCKFVPFVYDVCLMVSIHSLVLVAFERFYAVMRPLKAAIRTNQRCVFIITATWFFSFLLHAPYFYNYRLVEIQGQTYCGFSWEPLDHKKITKRIYIAIFLIFYIFPLGSISTLYCLIVHKLKRQRIPGTRYGHMIVNRQKRIVNTFRMVMTVVLAFFICWTPAKVYTMLVIYFWDFRLPCSGAAIIPHAELAMYILAFSNNAITPYIYFVFNENYKNGLKALLPWYERVRVVGYPRGRFNHSTNSSFLRSAVMTRVSYKQNSLDTAEAPALEQPTQQL